MVSGFFLDTLQFYMIDSYSYNKIQKRKEAHFMVILLVSFNVRKDSGAYFHSRSAPVGLY